MSKKISAVEWLVDKLQIFATEEEMNIIKQAKEMEKQQIIDAANHFISEWELHDGEQYYNETYKSE